VQEKKAAQKRQRGAKKIKKNPQKKREKERLKVKKLFRSVCILLCPCAKLYILSFV